MLTNHDFNENQVDVDANAVIGSLQGATDTKDLFALVDNRSNNFSQVKTELEKREKHANYRFGTLIGNSSKAREVFRIIEKVAATDSTVLITGESGTGKELIARAIHENSNRCNKPMVVINCGAIPGPLLESELFGHEKGAFTGAHRTRIGRFEMADGSTVFLDEIGDMSPELQVKLLRVIQEQSFERVGSTKPIKVNIRILAATNKNLFTAIKEGLFREDLYYRLNVIPIKVAALRYRTLDIPLLSSYFQKKLFKRSGCGLKTFTDAAMKALVKYKWPGNIRELENLMERLHVLVDNDEIDTQDLPRYIQFCESGDKQYSFGEIESGLSFSDAVEKYQKFLITRALNQTNWVKAKAATLLKMNRTTLVEKIKKMDLEAAP